MGHRDRLAAALALAGAAVVVSGPMGVLRRRLRRSWDARVAVQGDSMRPLLVPGDWLLVDPDAFRAHGARPGDLVVVPDPRSPDRTLVKRVAMVDGDGRYDVRGDSPGASTDSRTFGPVDHGSLAGRPWFRYWPVRRFGRIR
jgi:nickel-type superoxide dismutase maturation protease